jgi:hypothetical protein
MNVTEKLQHYPGCEWFCGTAHDTTIVYWCGCLRPTPRRGDPATCNDCRATIPEEQRVEPRKRRRS